MPLTPIERRLAYRNDLVKSLEVKAGPLVNKWLTPTETDWQPADFLPDFRRPDWRERIAILQKQAAAIPLLGLVVVIGNSITEETLGAYAAALQRLPAFADQTGADQTPFPRWSKGWQGQENRHGDFFMGYLEKTGRVDMSAVQRTVQFLYRSGFDGKIGNDSLIGVFYPGQQERMTKVSHGNGTQLGLHAGDETLHLGGKNVTREERQHEGFYTDLGKLAFDADPNESMVAYREVVDTSMVMPAAKMSDSGIVLDRRAEMFKQFEAAAHMSGVYRAGDYVDMQNHFIEVMDIPHRIVTTDEARKAQEFFEKLHRRNVDERGRIDELATRRFQKRYPRISFSWIPGEEIDLTKIKAS